MVKIRASVFETNSSSAHALVTGNAGIFKDFAEGRAVWVPYGLDDVPVELAPKCVVAGKQESYIAYCESESAAVFLRCSDIRDWAATLDEDHPYRKVSTAVDDTTVLGLLLQIHKELLDDYTGPSPHTWLSSRDVGFTILEDNKFQMEHDWNTWD